MKLRFIGYGLTTKAIANKFGGGFEFFDDKTTQKYIDENRNIIYPSKEYIADKEYIDILTPSIPPNHPILLKSKRYLSEYDLFLGDNSPYSLKEKPFQIWISGTNGKTTTTQMTTLLLKKRGAISGGNIGTPLANLDPKAPIWVLESSSFALYHTKKAAPNIYILLPITPDHIRWHENFENYKNAKLSPIARMKEGELALIPKGLNPPKSSAWIVEYEGIDDLASFFEIDPSKIDFKGAFLLDALLALSVTKTLFDEIDYNLINSFKPDRHRQEKIIDQLGRVWIDDSKATNIDATIEALKTFKDKKMHIILGGDDKGANLTPLFEELKKYNLIIYAIGSNATKIEELSKKYNLKAIKCNTLKKAVSIIKESLTKDEIALLSPAAASLDQFKSYKERGEKFREFILKRE
ncbi:MAG: UDP-N-acetylmuramoyl-L-alanine--D-glutamate ligase [Epsilonproteobacteria bacterium]|nr:UDP-N-acetylmuramoyl-L-alanine--D-glutamate ligase [Campylobacterota bacterium]